MENLLSLASKVTGPWSSAGFAIAAIAIILSRPSKNNKTVWNSVIIAVTALTPILAGTYLQASRSHSSVYQVRVTLLGRNNDPVDDGKVWSSIGGEAKKVAGGWELDIPEAIVPATRKLTVYAALAAAFLNGESEVTLSSDLHPSTTIRLAQLESKIKGMITDEKGRSVGGALVTVVGYGNESVNTKTDGNFELPAHAADGQEVQLHIERAGFVAENGWYPAGRPLDIALKKR